MPDISHALAGLLGGIPIGTVLMFFMKRWFNSVDHSFVKMDSNFGKVFDKLEDHGERIRAVEVRMEITGEMKATRSNGVR